MSRDSCWRCRYVGVGLAKSGAGAKSKFLCGVNGPNFPAPYAKCSLLW